MPLWAVSSLLSVSAFAQNRSDQEYREPEVEAGESPLTVGGLFETEYYEFNDLDMRRLDESSDQAILDSDDRGALAFTGASLDMAYTVNPQVRFAFSASHRGLWGDDQIGSVNTFGQVLYIPALFAELKTGVANGVVFTIGRQYFEIGTLGGGRDYILADILDMVKVDVPLGGAGRLTLIPLNVFSVSSDYSEIDIVSLIGQQYPETYNFRGDTLTRRFGFVATLDGIPGPLDVAAYGFYTDIGARGTGADISYQGELGNFADNDWVANFGARGTAAFGPVAPFAHVDLSQGIDRKELTALPVDCNGLAFGAGLVLDTTDEESGAGLTAEASGFYAYGPAYAKNGLQYSHGYVGPKGRQVGGTLLNRFMGWHPSAYVGRNGVDDRPNDTSRKAGSAVAHLEAGYQLAAGFRAWAGWWMLADNGYTELALGQIDDVTPPYGHSISEFLAQRRVGQVLANEVNLELGWDFGEHVEIYANGAYVLPGPYYAIEIDRVAGTALGSPDPAPPWAVYAGTRVEF